MNFIVENANVLIILVMIVLFWVLDRFKNLNKKELYQMAYLLVIKAENLYNEPKQGVTKKEYVINRLYEYIPTYLRFLISKEEIDHIIEESVKRMKYTLSQQF